MSSNCLLIQLSGPQDAGTNNALPRRALPEEFTRDLRKKVTHITFGSNPCRVRFFTQEIVLFREDLLRKMQRHVVVPPTLDAEGEGKEVDITEQLVSSILEQGHLCPLPLHVRPIYWDLDYTLRLTPLPHLVRLGAVFDIHLKYQGLKRNLQTALTNIDLPLSLFASIPAVL